MFPNVISQTVARRRKRGIQPLDGTIVAEALMEHSDCKAFPYESGRSKERRGKKTFALH